MNRSTYLIQKQTNKQKTTTKIIYQKFIYQKSQNILQREIILFALAEARAITFFHSGHKIDIK